jgi:uncharacterized protein (TIGR02284 family)
MPPAATAVLIAALANWKEKTQFPLEQERSSTMTHGQHLNGLNSLLRGELAATETYQQAMEKVGDDPDAVSLGAIHREHRETANTFREHVHQFGGKPDQSSGAWGAFAKAVTGTAKLFGPTAALKALKEGEEQGISAYEKALGDSTWPAECRTLITTALSRCRAHVRELDRLMARSS